MHDSLGEFIDAVREIGEAKDIRGAHWDREIGGLTELFAEASDDPPMLLFDDIVDHQPGFRVVTLALASKRRIAMTLGLDGSESRVELVRQASAKLREAEPIAAVEVADGPVATNTYSGDRVDMELFPSPKFHAEDGGRYIGTGCSIINRDPDTGDLNVGTYRIQVHDKRQLGLWMSPGQQGRQICDKYWAKGEPCPVVVTFGGDLLTFMASHQKLPMGVSELDYAGGLRGRPVEFIAAPDSGLPIPAQAEIAVEGLVPPPQEEAREEGPFGEWPGYYSGGTAGTGEAQPVINVTSVFYRDNPIILDMSPMWPGAPLFGVRLDAGLLWHQLERVGIQGITGVYTHYPYLVVIAIKQLYSGHAKQVGMAALGCSAAARNGRYVVIVDEDIDPSNVQEVLWAMETRVDPANDLDVVDGAWSTGLDPTMTPAKRAARDFTSSRAIFYAVRPFTWKDDYPRVSRSPKWLRDELRAKYASLLGSA